MSDEKRVATAEILNTSVHVSAKLNDRYQGPPGPPGKDGSMRFEDLTEAQIEQLRGPQGLTGKTPQMTVQVETGEPGTEASVIQSGTAEAPVIALTIPRGSTGATPQITVQVKTGEPGTAASVKQTGTVEAPVIELTIPRGDTGNIGSLTINGKTPDSAGKVELTAADVGARADDWMPTAADVGALSGTDATLTQAGEAADAEKTGTELSQLKTNVNTKVNQSDVLTLEEIQASSDLTNKVAGAEAVKTIKSDVWSLKQGGFYTEKNKGNTVPADYGGFIRITGSSWLGSFVSDTYYLGVASDGTAYSGTQINGNKQVTWKAL
jgi:hypothetical protein